MNWTPEQKEELKALCFEEKTNAELAEHFGVPVTEIHAKRSQLGITIPKVAAAKSKPAMMTVKPEFEAAVVRTEGLYSKYIVLHADTLKQIDGDSFVLRPDRDPAAVAALKAYAQVTTNEHLAQDILAWVSAYI